jgi:MFS family permease
LLFESLLKFFQELDRRIKILFTFIGIHQTHRQLTLPYNQLYATALGADPVELGTLTSIRSVVSSLVAIPSGWIADRYGPKRVLLLGLITTVAIAAIYSVAGNWWMLVPGLILYGLGQGLILPYVDMLFITIGGAENKSTIFSISRTLWAIPRIFSPIIAAIIITQLGGLSMGSEAIRPLYYIQFVLAILVILAIAILVNHSQDDAVKNTANPVRSERSFIQDFRDLFQGERYLTRYIAMSAIRTIGMNTAIAFVPLWMVNVKGANQYILGLMTATGMVTSMLLQVPVGRLSDRIGRKKTIFLLRPFTIVASLLLILAPRPEYLILVGILGGNVFGGGEGAGIGGTSFIPTITMSWEMVPAEKRGRWHGVQRFFGVLTFPASILGGMLWQQGHMVQVLVLPVILEVFIALPILITIPETLGRTSSH